ncbi:MAG: sulfatase-like hydrolase/transferase [Planctomycetota bacterium]|nr:sulfatase-like hydrolase/transferase [Planctomycetota bacterium]
MAHHPHATTRRDFLKTAGAASLGAWLLGAGCRPDRSAGTGQTSAAGAQDRPNILWITAEDLSPALGCYGDSYARTPHLDRLAAEGVRYTNAFATAPVCSPARSCLITGVLASSLGTMHLRSALAIPRFVRAWPGALREAGYYTTNNVKTDYNTADEPRLIKEAWDDCSAEAHWRGRNRGQPFFAVFNHMVSHQSRSMVWPREKFKKQVQSRLSPNEIHDPAEASVPPYYPDTPLIRRIVARFYDCVTVLDKQVGRLLDQLQEAGLADDTIVFFYGDHGNGMPRHKRAVLDTGMKVPLLVRFPVKYRHLAPAGPGRTDGRLVSFVDFPATVLSLVGLPIPDYMQGAAFLGSAEGKPRRYVHGHRDRVDEAYDCCRSVRDEQYLYIRNYMPHLSYHQPSAWPGQGEIRGEISRVAAQGNLTPPQRHYAGPTKPAEELYDCRADPLNLVNLVGDPKHEKVLQRLRKEHRRWVLASRDVGFLPECEIWRRSDGTTPYAMARDAKAYPLETILAAADLVGRGPGKRDDLVANLDAADPAVRFWAVIGLRCLGADAKPAVGALEKALADPSPPVRIEAAGALAGLGKADQAVAQLKKELAGANQSAVLRACRTLELMGQAARPAAGAVKAVLATEHARTAPLGMFVRFSAGALLKTLGEA